MRFAHMGAIDLNDPLSIFRRLWHFQKSNNELQHKSISMLPKRIYEQHREALTEPTK